MGLPGLEQKIFDSMENLTYESKTTYEELSEALNTIRGYINGLVEQNT